jgi:hypothetical protein
VNLRFIDWIWRVRGTLPLAPAQTGDEAFERLDPLFRQNGTTRKRTGSAMTFSKKDPAAQDKMSVFDGGVLTVEEGATGPVLRYDLVSRALLFCFLAPFMFLAFAQVTIAIGKWQKPSAEAAKTAEARKKEEEKKDVEVPMNPIDKFLGAPEPEKPKKDEKDKDEEGDRKKPSPTAAYVFAGIFSALYLIGRVLEDRLIKRLFRKSLLGS